MFYPWCFFPREIFETRGPTGVKFCTVVSTKLSFIMPVQNFEGIPQKNFRGQKNAKFGSILVDFIVERRISLKRMNVYSKLVSNSFDSDSARVRQNKSGDGRFSDLGDLDVDMYPPKTHYLEEHISASKRCCPPNFLQSLENDQDLLAHSQPGTEALLTTFFKRGHKLA